MKSIDAANIQSTLKRTKSLAQSDLSDFVFEPGNLFQGGVENGARCKIYQTLCLSLGIPNRGGL
ncbi:hypothetical protein [Calothrix sp. CCY 0018]|uniref:hypothetical protein n=1 Tax=Calothrix sp. CCY 0018 TaxID=3103864 RepID=UPI0039C692C3